MRTGLSGRHVVCLIRIIMTNTLRYTTLTGRTTSLRTMPTRRPSTVTDAWCIVNGYANEVPTAARLPGRCHRDDEDASEHMGAHALASFLIVVLMIILACAASVAFA